MYILYHIFLILSNKERASEVSIFWSGPAPPSGFKKGFFYNYNIFFLYCQVPARERDIESGELYLAVPAIQSGAGRPPHFRENLARIQAAGKSKKIAYRGFTGGNSRRVARKRRVEHAQGCPGVLSMLIKKMSIENQCSFQGLFFIFLCCLLQQTKISFSIITSSMPLWCSTNSSFPLINL